MRLCIIGDSWAGNVPCNHGIFDQRLGPMGHDIVNISAGGASNFGQLTNLRYGYLEKKQNFDCVIWIHTECARDFTEFVSLDHGNDRLARQTQFPDLTLTDLFADFAYIQNQNFAYAQTLSDRFQTLFMIIGGAGPIRADLNGLSSIVWCLPSWHQEICGFKVMPWNCYSYHVGKMLEFGRYDKNQALEELDQIDTLEKYMHDRRDLYPDGKHPSLDCYAGLAQKIQSQLDVLPLHNQLVGQDQGLRLI